MPKKKKEMKTIITPKLPTSSLVADYETHHHHHQQQPTIPKETALQALNTIKSLSAATSFFKLKSKSFLKLWGNCLCFSSISFVIAYWLEPTLSFEDTIASVIICTKEKKKKFKIKIDSHLGQEKSNKNGDKSNQIPRWTEGEKETIWLSSVPKLS